MMRQEHSRCEPGQIEQWLDGGLSAAEQTRFENHLEACTTCRQRLETAAADANDWQEAADHLRDDALDRDVGPAGVASLSDADLLGASSDFTALRIADYLDPTDDPRMLGRFGGYEIAGVIGCGGMGVVLKGYETSLQRFVAIKVLAPHLAASGAARARFAREARAAAAVLHENVVAIHRVAEAKSLPYLVMPYVPGDSLQKRLDEQGPLQVTEILRIGMQIAAGLAAAHAQGLVHRDIKPGNILLDRGVERVTITDFGLARAMDDASLTRSGVIAGTPQYMSPEQARGEPLDGRSDLFSLGSVLYALCVGRPPFRAETAFGVLRHIGETEPTPIRELVPEVPEWLCEIIEKLHAKKPEERFSTADEVAGLLGRWLAHVQQPTVIPAPKRTGRRRKRGSRNQQVALVGTIGLAAIGVTAAVVFLAPAWNEAENEPRAAPVVVAGPVQPSAEDTASDRNNAAALRQRAIDPGRQEAQWTESLHAVSPAMVDEQTMRNECQTMRQEITEIEGRWSQPAPTAGAAGWQTAIEDVRRQLDDLSQRIDAN